MRDTPIFQPCRCLSIRRDSYQKEPQLSWGVLAFRWSRRLTLWPNKTRLQPGSLNGTFSSMRAKSVNAPAKNACLDCGHREGWGRSRKVLGIRFVTEWIVQYFDTLSPCAASSFLRVRARRSRTPRYDK